MTIIHGFDRSGGFIAADTDTGRSVYAYPTSPHADKAKRHAKAVAAEMTQAENSLGAWRDRADYRERDARNITAIVGFIVTA